MKRNILIILIVLLPLVVYSQPYATPDAVGFGSVTRGAYSGSATPIILRVDTLIDANYNSDATHGSFRWAIEENYPRIILFERSGYVTLSSYLDIVNDYVSIYGQTAPSPGITIRNQEVQTHGSNIIIQHLRFRLGNESVGDKDALSILSGDSIFVDHCSFSWANDENVSVSGGFGANVTLSNNISSECLNDPNSKPDGHSMGMLMNLGDSATVYGNYFVNLRDRAPMMSTYFDHLIVANNLLYNVEHNEIYIAASDDSANVSVLGNYMKKGPETLANVDYIAHVNDLWSGSCFFEENYSPLYDADNRLAVVNFDSDTTNWYTLTPTIVDNSFEYYQYDSVPIKTLSMSGARPKDRDSVDTYVVNDYIYTTGAIPDDMNDVYYPILAENTITLSVPADPNNDSGNGYTNLEMWVYDMHVELTDTLIDINPTFETSDTMLYKLSFCASGDEYSGYGIDTTWNNISYAGAGTDYSLIDSIRGDTTYELSSTSSWDGQGFNGEITGIYPDSIRISNWFSGDGTTKLIQFTNTDGKHDVVEFTFFSSRSGTPGTPRILEFIIGNDTTELDGYGNETNTTSLTVYPETSIIDLTMNQLDGSFGYLNVIEIYAYDTTINPCDTTNIIISSEITPAPEGTIILTIEGGKPLYTYEWSDGAATQNRTGLDAGTYSVIVTDANGCTGNDSYQVSIISTINRVAVIGAGGKVILNQTGKIISQ